MDLSVNKYKVQVSGPGGSTISVSIGGTPTRIYGPAQPTDAPATIYTVPADTRTTLSYIRIVNTAASQATLTLSIGADAPGTREYSEFPIDANGVFAEFVELTMEAAETLQISQAHGSPFTAALTVTINAKVESTL